MIFNRVPLKPSKNSCYLPRLFSTSTTSTSSNSSTPSKPSYTITEAPIEPVKDEKKIKRGIFKLSNIPGHTKKLNPLARQIVGRSVNEAIAQMAFAPQSRAKLVKQAIEKAAVNADFYHDVSKEDLLVERAWTGKQFMSPRVRYHSKGRAGRSYFRTSTVWVRLREMLLDEKEKLNKFKSNKITKKESLSPRGY
jgi:large subunit ribosomal protein L22